MSRSFILLKPDVTEDQKIAVFNKLDQLTGHYGGEFVCSRKRFNVDQVRKVFSLRDEQVAAEARRLIAERTMSCYELIMPHALEEVSKAWPNINPFLPEIRLTSPCPGIVFITQSNQEASNFKAVVEAMNIRM